MPDPESANCTCLGEALAALDLGDDVDVIVVTNPSGVDADRMTGLVDAAVAAGRRRLLLVVPTPLPLHSGGRLDQASTVGLATAGARNAAVRMAPRGTANVVLVGPLDVGARCGPACQGVDAGHRTTIEAESITGRLSTVDEVAAAIAFLASDDADYVSGIVLPVDGGLSAGRYA